MKSETVSGLAIALTLALVVAVGLAVYLIGSDRLFILAAVLVGGLAVAVVLGALALVMRAYRKNDSPPVVEHHYHDGTRTVVREVRVLDNRPQPIPQLPAPPQPPFGVFPELLRASYQAGLLTSGQGETVDAEARDVTAPEGWEGDING